MRKTLLQIGTLGALILGGRFAAADKVDTAIDKTAQTAHKTADATGDSWLTAKTKIALFADRRVSGSKINVETKQACVTLRGKVDSKLAKDAAAEIAKGVDGVKEVKDELQVVTPVNRRVVDAKDDQIVATVNKNIAKEKVLANDKIDVRSDAGVVTLSGQVGTLLDSAIASEAAFKVDGVKSVNNTLTLKNKL